MSGWVIPLSADPRRCGNKIANLARMRAVGLRTPDGFAISTQAFQTIVPIQDLAGRVAAIVGDRPYDLDRLRAAHEEALNLIQALPWPSWFAAELRAGLAGLHDTAGSPGDGHGTAGGRSGASVPLAVRSSASWEDAAERSAAGQLHSEIGVAGGDQVREAVVRVWASAFTPSAIAYQSRITQGHPGPVAVAVQRLVRGEVSGVAYSAHPITGDTSVMVVEAVRGLPGPLVSGRVVPEHIELHRSGQVVHRRTARQHIVAEYDDTVQAVVERPADAWVALTGRHLDAVRSALLRAEAQLQHPVDMEWSYDRRCGLVVLQVRPVTAVAVRR